MHFQLDVNFTEGDSGKHLEIGSYVNKYSQIRVIRSSGYYNHALISKLLKKSSSVTFFLLLYSTIIFLTITFLSFISY